MLIAKTQHIFTNAVHGVWISAVFYGITLQYFIETGSKSEVYEGPSQTSMMKFFAKVVNSLQPLTVFGKSAES